MQKVVSMFMCFLIRTHTAVLVIRAFAIRVFAYPRFYFNITRSINILSATIAEAATLQQIRSRNSNHITATFSKMLSLTSKLRIWVIFVICYWHILVTSLASG
jgi:hypothetical protein